jgi:hypothetical protein
MRRVLAGVLVFGALFFAQTVRTDSILIATLNGAQEGTASTATGFGSVILNTAQTMITVNESWRELVGGPATATHIHCCAPPGSNAGVLFPFAGVPNAVTGAIPTQMFAITPLEVSQLEAGLMYFNVHDAEFQAEKFVARYYRQPRRNPRAWGFWRLGCSR